MGQLYAAAAAGLKPRHPETAAPASDSGFAGARVANARDPLALCRRTRYRQ